MASSKANLDFILEQFVDNKNFLMQLFNAIYDELPMPKKI